MRKYLLLIILFNIGISYLNAQIKWSIINSPTGNTLRNLVFTDNLNGWAAGDSGTIIHTSDGGQNWLLQNSGLVFDVFSINFPDKNHGWALCIDDYSNSIILNTTDGGNNWFNTTYNGNDILSSIVFLDSLNGWAGGYMGSILITSDGGNNWNIASVDTLTGYSVHNFLSVSKNCGFAFGGKFDRCGVIWKTIDGGLHWKGQSIGADPIQSLQATDSLNILGIGGDFEFGTACLKSTNGGESWNYRKLSVFGIGLNLSFRTKTESWAPLNNGVEGRIVYTKNSGETWKEFQIGSFYMNDIKFIDSAHGIAVGLNGVILSYVPDNPKSNFMVNVNRFSVPVNNCGVIGDISIGGGTYDSKLLLYSAGFYLSGVTNGNLWTNGSAYESGIQDYQPGIVGSDPSDKNNKVYVVKSSDPAFSESWQDWKNAVALGADFYDGNNDGLYNPVDLNGNGKWDPGEDRPDLLGDITAWSVFNDGVSAPQRKFNDVQPQGIEIKQSLFAINDSTNLQNAFFVRYRIENRGTVADRIDSVYFGIWNDPDIGNPIDDYLGCDTLYQSGFVYNNGNDMIFGATPPSLFVSYLQGPAVFIPGVTFLDNNSNGVFDDGIDTPIDTAWDFKGQVKGKSLYPGAKNLNPSSFIQLQNNYKNLTDPTSKFEARNLITGKNKLGLAADPCNWPLGTVSGGINCNQINNMFLYSGDPVTLIGWLNRSSSDQKMLYNTGPFTLIKGKPVDIIVSYTAGTGTDPVNSISVARNICAAVRNYYNQNLPISNIDGISEKTSVPLNYILFQNYPNPFNPITTIKYQLKFSGWITLKIYDILGREVAVIVNEEKPAGDYSVTFNADKLSSGIYFYKIQTGNFVNTKKMILLK